jgi:two-component system cell cycle sensor histidine kinase/response regulator CckA
MKDQCDEFGNRGTILVADDQEMARKVTVRMLERMGFDTLMAADGEEAVAVFRKQKSRISACILDHVMPKMNGDEAYREIRKIDPSAKIIMASGFSEQEIGLGEEIGGINALMNKPYSREELAEALGQLLDN